MIKLSQTQINALASSITKEVNNERKKSEDKFIKQKENKYRNKFMTTKEYRFILYFLQSVALNLQLKLSIKIPNMRYETEIYINSNDTINKIKKQYLETISYYLFHYINVNEIANAMTVATIEADDLKELINSIKKQFTVKE